MMEKLYIGSTPCEEPCAQVGQLDYEERVMEECERYIRLLVQMFSPIPDNVKFRAIPQSHDFGTYWEVAIVFDPTDSKAEEFAINVENNLPETWDGSDL